MKSLRASTALAMSFIWRRSSHPARRIFREDQMEDFSHWLGDVLLEWIIDGVDDTPEPGF